MPVLSNSQYERFAQEIAKGSSASAAYVAAGYAKNDSNASRLNRNEQVRERVTEIQQAGAEAAGVTIQGIVDELADIAFISRNGKDEKTADRISALEKLGKHLGMFKEKIEHSGPDGVPFTFKLDRAGSDG